MKTLILATALVLSSAVKAHVVEVLDIPIPQVRTYDTRINTQFQIDRTTGEGSIYIHLGEYRYIHVGDTVSQTLKRIHRSEVKIDGLMLLGDVLTYAAPSGDVVCGTLGQSRIFKRPIIRLSGNCRINASVEGRRPQRLVVNLEIK